jgi:hypothetical protein
MELMFGDSQIGTQGSNSESRNYKLDPANSTRLKGGVIRWASGPSRKETSGERVRPRLEMRKALPRKLFCRSAPVLGRPVTFASPSCHRSVGARPSSVAPLHLQVPSFLKLSLSARRVTDRQTEVRRTCSILGFTVFDFDTQRHLGPNLIAIGLFEFFEAVNNILSNLL